MVVAVWRQRGWASRARRLYFSRKGQRSEKYRRWQQVSAVIIYKITLKWSDHRRKSATAVSEKRDRMITTWPQRSSCRHPKHQRRLLHTRHKRRSRKCSLSLSLCLTHTYTKLTKFSSFLFNPKISGHFSWHSVIQTIWNNLDWCFHIEKVANTILELIL